MFVLRRAGFALEFDIGFAEKVRICSVRKRGLHCGHGQSAAYRLRILPGLFGM